MPRAIWKGTISFGLVTIPVSLYSAESRSDHISFNMLDRRDMSRIQQRRVNATTGEEVPWEEIVKGYEYEPGQYVVVSEEELTAATPEATQTVNIVSVVKTEEIPQMYFETPYYLEPTKGGRKAYALLRETFRRTGYVGIARVVIRTREYVGALIPEGNLMLLHLMRYHYELKDPAELDLPGDDLKALGIQPKELQMAEQLVKAMVGSFSPEEYEDTYRQQLLELIEQKARTGKIEVAPGKAEAPRAEVVDIMSLLKRSLENVEKSAQRKEPARSKKTKSTTTEIRRREKTPA